MATARKDANIALKADLTVPGALAGNPPKIIGRGREDEEEGGQRIKKKN